MTTNKQKYLDACLILHGMCLDWLHEHGLLITADKEIQRAAKYRTGCETIDKSFTDDDEYMIEYPEDKVRTYVSHLDCVSVKLGDEWLKIDRAFRSNISFMLDMLETRSFNDGLLEFFDEAVSSSYDVSTVDETPTVQPPSKLQVLTDMAVAESLRNDIKRTEMMKAAADLDEHAELEDIVNWITKYFTL